MFWIKLYSLYDPEKDELVGCETSGKGRLLNSIFLDHILVPIHEILFLTTLNKNDSKTKSVSGCLYFFPNKSFVKDGAEQRVIYTSHF